MTIEDFTVSLSGQTDREASNQAEDLLGTTLIAVESVKIGPRAHAGRSPGTRG